MLEKRSKSRKNSIHYLNLMMVGLAGTGKTSFMRTFYETIAQEDILSLQESRPRLLKDAVQPTQEITRVSIQIRDGTALTLIDTPGFTTGFENQVNSLAKYIDLQFERTLVEETKVKRDPKAIDTHIHSCIYVIDGLRSLNGLREADRCIIRMLSARVNIIPVIGKADRLTMTQVQQVKANFRKEVFDIFHIPIYGYIPVEPPSATSFSNMVDMLQQCVKQENDEDAKVMLDYLDCMPFTVISYEEEQATGRPIQIGKKTDGPILGRRYPWAVIQCNNTNHCDFDALKSTVLSMHRDLLRMETFEHFYEQYRTEQLLKRNIGRMTRIKSKTGVPLI